MDRYVAFLRGMNLGGRRITNEDLRSHFEALGCEEVATFRASGNVILTANEEEEPLAARLEAGLEERLGYAVPIFLRSADELPAIAAALGPTTIRTKGTIDQIAARHFGHPR